MVLTVIFNDTFMFHYEQEILLIIATGFLSGLLMGFLFRNSDAEREQAIRNGYHHWLMRTLYAPVWNLRGFLFLLSSLGVLILILWLPGHLLGVFPLHGNAFYIHKAAILIGVLIGWFLRYLLWKRYLRWF